MNCLIYRVRRRKMVCSAICSATFKGFVSSEIRLLMQLRSILSAATEYGRRASNVFELNERASANTTTVPRKLILSCFTRSCNNSRSGSVSSRPTQAFRMVVY